MLKKVFLVRHAQSEEDVDPNVRNSAHDTRISITSVGKQQVVQLVDAMTPKIGDYQRVKIITSPSTRADQTTFLFCSRFPTVTFDVVHEECIRNLNWGNVDETTMKEVEQERYRVGVLYFQFPGGDDTPKFVKKIEEFVARLLQDGLQHDHPKCVIIFTHGFALRVIAKAFLSMSDEEFRYLSNPPNCYVATINITQSGIDLEEPLPRIKFKI